MPLSTSFTEQSSAEWVHGKDEQWRKHGYGPWAVVVNGEFAGWGGFQQEQNGADFALVLAWDQQRQDGAHDAPAGRRTGS